jgi:hypothetical protein
VLLEAGPGGAGAGGDVVDDQSGAAGERELLAQNRGCPGEAEADFVRVGSTTSPVASRGSAARAERHKVAQASIKPVGHGKTGRDRDELRFMSA